MIVDSRDPDVNTQVVLSRPAAARSVSLSILRAFPAECQNPTIEATVSRGFAKQVLCSTTIFMHGGNGDLIGKITIGVDYKLMEQQVNQGVIIKIDPALPLTSQLSGRLDDLISHIRIVSKNLDLQSISAVFYYRPEVAANPTLLEKARQACGTAPLSKKDSDTLTQKVQQLQAKLNELEDAEYLKVHLVPHALPEMCIDFIHRL